MAQFRETVYQESAPRVGADEGVLYGVKVLGENSRNKRRYAPQGMREAIALYNGAKSYIDHPGADRLSEDRKFSDWAGVFQNARYEEGRGIFADLHLRKTGEHFEGILEAAQKFPTAVGFSHVAEGESRVDGDTEIVESIREVFSVDLVTDPATTAGFFESRRKPKTLKTAIESLPDGTVRKRLIEMADLGQLDGSLPMDGDDKPTDPLTQMGGLVKELIRMLGETLKALAAKQDAPPPVPPAAPHEALEDDMAQETKEQDKAAFESLKKEHAAIMAERDKLLQENAALQAKVLLLESGREASAVRVKALAEAAEADRAALLESWPQLEAGERPLRSPAAISESAASPARVRERFAALLK